MKDQFPQICISISSSLAAVAPRAAAAVVVTVGVVLIVASKDSGISEYIKSRIAKAQGVFSQLKKSLEE